MVADAAEAADDEPRASMIAAPRLATVGMKSFSSQAWSPTTSAALLAADLGVEEVGVLGGGVVAPDRHLLDVGDRGAGLGGELRDRAVVVEPGQRREPLPRDVGGVGHRDQRVGVGGVAGDADPDVVGGDLVEGLALGGEDRAVGLEQVAALHARAARAGADEQGEVDAVEDRRRGRSRSRRRPGSGTRSRRAPSRRPRAPCSAGSISSSRSSIGRSAPSSDPLARRKSRL